MKQCPNCRSQITDEAVFCPVCGTSISAFHSFPEPYPPQEQASRDIPPYKTAPGYAPVREKTNPYDHSALFGSSDIAENKNWCMLLYLMDIIGIGLILLRKQDSEYTRFHLAQAVKFTVLECVLTFVSMLLCWTVLVPVFGAVALVVVMVVKFICFVQVCKGKAVEPPIIRSIKFLN